MLAVVVVAARVLDCSRVRIRAYLPTEAFLAKHLSFRVRSEDSSIAREKSSHAD
jgi:hypothetical protein